MNRRVVIAGASSGVGKTLVASAISYALRTRGYKVQPFKVGPDYIDPGYLSHAAARPARNLDSWLMGKDGLVESYVRASTDADISVIEGVMGYYDGLSGKTNQASTYEVSRILDAPVILVVNSAKAARSVGALVAGFAKYQPLSRIAGVVLNHVGSKRHVQFCTDAIEQLHIPVIGAIPRNSSLELRSRHLGLVPVPDSATSSRAALRAIKAAVDYIDIDAVEKISRSRLVRKTPLRSSRSRKKRTRICVALDSSFNFYYQDNLEALKSKGAELRFFSPTIDKKIPPCDALYLGGGFPEVRASLLAKNSAMRKAVLRHATKERLAVYAECGGLMYLLSSISQGAKKHAMAGVIDGDTVMTKKMVLNYTSAKVSKDCLVAGRSSLLRGHEFHYSRISNLGADTSFAYSLERGEGIRNKLDGIVQDEVLASYGHLYIDSKRADIMINGICKAARA